MNESTETIRSTNCQHVRIARATRLLIALILAMAFAGCGREHAANPASADTLPTASPILLIGVDGLEWGVVAPLLAQRRLPNLAKLMQRGSYGRLQSFRPTSSPVIWTSVATGKVHPKHGILSFVRLDSNGKLALYDNSDRKTKAIWNILTDYGKRVCTIGWWMTFPAEQVNGVMVAQTNTISQLDTRFGKAVWKGTLRRGLPGQVYPPQRQNEMISVLEQTQRELPDLTRRIFGDFPHPLSLLGRRLWKNCLWAFRADATYFRIASRLLREPQSFDLMLIYFGGADVVGHRFWRYAYPELYRHRPSPEQIENFGSIIHDYYAYVDVKVGQLIAASSPDTTVIIMSDHGMRPYRRRRRFDPDQPPQDVNSGHHKQAPPGLFVAAGPYIKKSVPQTPPHELKSEDLTTVGSVYDITPTILALLRIPLGEDMDGKVLAHLIRDEFNLASQPDPVKTHDTPEFLANRRTAPLPAPDQEERLRQLRSLGYLDDAGD